MTNYKKWQYADYFDILAEIAYCISKFTNPKLINDLTLMFIDIIDHERHKLLITPNTLTEVYTEPIYALPIPDIQ